MMDTATMTPEQIRQTGLKAVYQALGAAGLLRFLQQFELGHGDYTAERQQWLNRYTLDELLAEAKQTGPEVPSKLATTMNARAQPIDQEAEPTELPDLPEVEDK